MCPALTPWHHASFTAGPAAAFCVSAPRFSELSTLIKSGAGLHGAALSSGHPKAIQGLYMYGGVGCGKTMLMDLLVASAPREFQVRAECRALWPRAGPHLCDRAGLGGSRALLCASPAHAAMVVVACQDAGAPAEAILVCCLQGFGGSLSWKPYPGLACC